MESVPPPSYPPPQPAPAFVPLLGARAALWRAESRALLDEPWQAKPTPAFARAANALLEIVREERHLTHFLKNHYACDSREACTHCTRVSLGTPMGHTVAARLKIPIEDLPCVLATLCAVSSVGGYQDRAYVTECFPGTLFRAHFELDHTTGAPTSLDDAAAVAWAHALCAEYECAARVFKSTRGGNRAHVFLDRSVSALEMASWLPKASGLLDEACGRSVCARGECALDPSTIRYRSIRAPFAKSPKAFQDHYYQPWCAYDWNEVSREPEPVADMTTEDWLFAAGFVRAY